MENIEFEMPEQSELDKAIRGILGFSPKEALDEHLQEILMFMKRNLKVENICLTIIDTEDELPARYKPQKAGSNLKLFANLFLTKQREIPSTKSLLYAPIVVNDEFIGLVIARNKLQSQKFTDKDVEIFSYLTEQIAVSIDRIKLHHRLSRAFLDLIKTLLYTLKIKSYACYEHSRRVALYSASIARQLPQIDTESVQLLKISALLHDIGKIGIPEELLEKTDPLLVCEYERIKKHPILGCKIVERIKEFKPFIPGIKYHHEHFDGTGYPCGLKGEEIPIWGRIICVADTFDALTTDRPYKSKVDQKEAIKIIRKESGKKFDPKIVKAFLKAYSEEISKIF